MDQVGDVRGELVGFGELGNILDRTVGSVLKGVQGRKTGRGYFPQRSHQLALGPRLVTVTAPAGLEHQWHVPRHRDGSRTGLIAVGR